MPIFETIHRPRHALERMGERGSRRLDVELKLRTGQGRPGKRGTWIHELGSWRVVTMETGDSARIITVVRLRGRK